MNNAFSRMNVRGSNASVSSAPRASTPPRPAELPIEVDGGDINVKQWDNDTVTRWHKIERPNGKFYLKFDKVVKLDVEGSVRMNKLMPEKRYKGKFEVELDRDAQGWIGHKVTIEVYDHVDRMSSCNTYSLLNDTLIKSVAFRTPKDISGRLTFRLYQHSDHVKTGLTIKRFTINLCE